MSELQIVKRNGTLYKTSVSALAREIIKEFKTMETVDFINDDEKMLFNAIFEAVENLIGDNDDTV